MPKISPEGLLAGFLGERERTIQRKQKQDPITDLLRAAQTAQIQQQLSTTPEQKVDLDVEKARRIAQAKADVKGTSGAIDLPTKLLLAQNPDLASIFLPQQAQGQPGGAGQVAPIAPTQPQPGAMDALGLKSASISPTGTTLKLGETPSQQMQRTVETSKQQDISKETREKSTNFRRAMSLFGVTSDKFAKKVSAQGGGGVIPGIQGFFAEKMRAEGASDIAEFQGQLKETALGLNNILTNQNRAIIGVIQMIHDTLPQRLDSTEFALGKLSQSMDNAFGLKIATDKGLWDENQFAGMPIGDISFNKEGVRVLNDRTFKSLEKGAFEEEKNEVLAFVTSLQLTSNEEVAKAQLKIQQLRPLLKSRAEELGLSEAEVAVNELDIDPEIAQMLLSDDPVEALIALAEAGDAEAFAELERMGEL